MSAAKRIKEDLTESPDIIEIAETDICVPLGSIMLNLACSDRPDAACALGRYINLIGDSSSGKTFVAMSVLADAANNAKFKDYRLILDDAEHAMSMNIEGLFGPKLATRLTAPNAVDGIPAHSSTVEEFHDNFLRQCEVGKPFIYVLDSFDALSSEDETAKILAEKEAREAGKDVPGTYGMERAKSMSRFFRNVTATLAKLNSFLIIISQTRDNVNPMSPEKKTRSGGRAMKFYASHEIWLTCTEKLKARDRVIGVVTKAQVKKNKLTGKVREVYFPIYYDYGIDDTTSCIDFLVDEKVWGKNKQGMIDTGEFCGCGHTRVLAAKIEKDGKRQALLDLTAKTWAEIEESLRLTDRQAKYAAT